MCWAAFRVGIVPRGLAGRADVVQSANLPHERAIAIAYAIIAYAVLMIALGQYSSGRVESQEDYLVAGRRLPLWLAWGTLLATWFGAATVIGASQAARDEGLRGTLLDPFASGLALVIAGIFFAGRMWKMNLLTMGDFFARRYGRKTETVSSVVQAASYYPWLAGQYLALSVILNDAFGWSKTFGLFVAVVFVLYLTVIGGMWSVTVTDTAQAFILLGCLAALGYTFFDELGNGNAIDGVASAWQATPDEHRTLLPESYALAWLAWTSTLATGTFGNIPGQDLMQRVFSARSPRVAAQACILAGIVYVAFGLIPVGMGLASTIVIPESDSANIITAIAATYLSPTMHVVFVIALMAIVVSTATSALLAPSALLARNVFEHAAFFRARPLVTDRMCVVVSAVISLAVAFSGEHALGLLEQALEISLVALLVPFLGGFFGRPKGELTGLLSVLLGSVVWIAYNLAGWWLLPADLDPKFATSGQALLLLPAGLVGVAASALGYALGQMISKAPAAEPLAG